LTVEMWGTSGASEAFRLHTGIEDVAVGVTEPFSLRT
jgi:hypothetical protein